ncbi:MAG TPA: hypothetical protein VFZ75_11330 [Actinomycetota bacterium]|nr:hypothetical protein [Actinomycetota bacterium]
MRRSLGTAAAARPASRDRSIGDESGDPDVAEPHEVPLLRHASEPREPQVDLSGRPREGQREPTSIPAANANTPTGAYRARPSGAGILLVVPSSVSWIHAVHVSGPQTLHVAYRSPTAPGVTWKRVKS